MEKLRNNGLRSALLVAGALSLASCVNYSGEGNDFVVRGQVTDTGTQSLKAEVYLVESVEGKADGRFEIGEENRFHDNCDCHGMWKGRKQYGYVYDRSGAVIEPSDVAEGECVLFTGKVREQMEGKIKKNRPVYETAEIINCGM